MIADGWLSLPSQQRTVGEQRGDTVFKSVPLTWLVLQVMEKGVPGLII